MDGERILVALSALYIVIIAERRVGAVGVFLALSLPHGGAQQQQCPHTNIQPYGVVLVYCALLRCLLSV